MEKKEQANCTNIDKDKKELAPGSNADIYKRYNLTGKKLSQQEIDLLVARYKAKKS